MGGTARTLLQRSLTSNLLSQSVFSTSKASYFLKFSLPSRVLLGFRPLCSATTSIAPTVVEADQVSRSPKHSILLEKLRIRHIKEVGRTSQTETTSSATTSKKSASSKAAVGNEGGDGPSGKLKKKNSVQILASSFEELGLNEEVIEALKEMNISDPTEIQCVGIPAVLEGKSVVLGSHTGSGKTLAYMLPIVQLLRRDEAMSGILMKPRRPRAVVLCPTRELSEQVYHVAKLISHHARFRSIMVSGGGRLRPQEDSLNSPIDMVVGTPGRILQHIQDGNMVFGDIRYLVLDEADTMFDHGFGPDIRKFIDPLKNRASKSNDAGFQTVLVAATMTNAVQKLIEEEFQGIVHLRTSTLHKKVASARHDFIKLSGSENKMEALLQVLEPSLAKGNKVMVFCNTLDSSRAVDHFLSENQIYTVNYHGEVPAEQRVENLKKFKTEDGDCPTLVCTDLAARGLDMDVDHVIMFDFPKNSIDYLHRTGRTARMGAKGKVTSLVAKKDLMLASRIEEAIRKNESLESLSVDGLRRDMARSKILQQKERGSKMAMKAPKKEITKTNAPTKPTKKFVKTTAVMKTPKRESTKKGAPVKATKKIVKTTHVKVFKTTKKPIKSSKVSSSKTSRSSESSRGSSKMSVIGFRGRSSSRTTSR